jgi:membrane associated rhomboid family serine protease
MAEEEEQKLDKQEPNRVQMTSGDIVRLIIAAPVVFTWLFLGSRIIISATNSETVLNNVEPLLTVLAVLTIPVTGILQSLFSTGGDKK